MQCGKIQFIYSIICSKIENHIFINNYLIIFERDWVGGRYSVWSAIGMLPISLMFGFDVAMDFLKGGETVDKHLLNNIKDLSKNIPMLLAFMGFYNISIEGFQSRALLPYC